VWAASFMETASQDAGLGAVAVGVAGQMAKVVVDKAEDEMKKKMASQDTPLPCIGDHCCEHSSCMNVPGLGCDRDRGPTKCIGSSLFPPTRGLCACLVGACSIDGKCSSKGLPNTFEDGPVSSAPTPAQVPSSPEDDFNTWHGQGVVPAPPQPEDDFSRWHTNPQRLFFQQDASDDLETPQESLLSFLLLVVAGMAMMGGLVFLFRPLQNELRERAWQGITMHLRSEESSDDSSGSDSA